MLRQLDRDRWETYRNSLPTQHKKIEDKDGASRFEPEAKNTAFCGREYELNTLKAFCEDERPFLWWAVTAAGGSGKTRLIMELSDWVKTKETENWSVRKLKHSEYNNDVFSSIQSSAQKLLVISDYAAEYAETLAGWIERLSEPEGGKIRLLLAERDVGIREKEHEWEIGSSMLQNPWYERMKASGVNLTS